VEKRLQVWDEFANPKAARFHIQGDATSGISDQQVDEAEPGQ